MNKAGPATERVMSRMTPAILRFRSRFLKQLVLKQRAFKQWGAIREDLARYLLIAALVGACAAAFAYVAGWLSPGRLSADRIVDALEAHDGKHPGFRRAHAKGLCFSGTFDSNGQGGELSRASVFQPGRYPLIGRFSTGGGMPQAPDGRVVFHAVGLSFSLPHGELWRAALDDVPIFPVATPQAFFDFQRATAPDPATGKPDAARIAAYLAVHPETRAFNQWLKDNPVPSSFANGTYYSINAFRFTDAEGVQHFVRWSLVPEAAFEALDKSTLSTLDKNYLFGEVIGRIQQGPQRWHLLLSVAEPGDTIDNATVQWPASRRAIDAGTLTIDHASLEDDGACRDITFDPLVLPAGIGPSDDPLLSARSAAYSSSLTRRSGEPAQPSALAQEHAAGEKQQ